MSEIQLQTERELKLQLTQAQWLTLRDDLGTPERIIEQTNTYFDTAARELKHTAALMVRIRQADQSFELTAKDRIEGESTGLLETRERTQSLDAETAQRLLQGELSLTALDLPLCIALAAEVGGDLLPIGAVQNTREVYRLLDGYIAEVDRTDFLGRRVDYEVEIELRTPAHSYDGARAMLAMNTSLDCSSLVPSRSKYGRFLELSST
jgi:uncharacterized protein YjbK